MLLRNALFVLALCSGLMACNKGVTVVITPISDGVSIVSQPVLIVGGYGEGPGQLQSAGRLTVGNDGKVYVADNVAKTVVVYDVDGTHVASLSFGPDSGENRLLPVGTTLSRVMGLDIAKNGDLLVSDFKNIYRRTTAGEVSRVATDSLKGNIWGIAIDSHDRIYVAADRHKEVQRFSADGSYTSWEIPTERGRARSIAVGPDDHVYVALRDDARTLRYTPEGELVGEYGKEGETITEDDAEGVAITSNGNIYIGDEDGARYVVFDSLGRHLASFGKSGSAPSQHLRGFDFVFDEPRNRMIVSDRGNYRIKYLTTTGEVAPTVDRSRIDNPLGPKAVPDHIVLHLTEHPTTSIQMVWRTNSDVMGSVTQINLGETFDEATARTVTNPNPPERFHSNMGVYNTHGVLVDGLTPATRYAYRVGDGTHWSQPASFETQQAGDDITYSAVVLGDSRNRYDVWQDIVTMSGLEKPNVIINTGDLISSGWNQLHWDQYFDRATSQFASIPFMPSMGNHEAPFDNYLAQFILPENGPEGFKEYAYYFEIGSSIWISLSSEHDLAPQREWLKKVLAENTKPWKFVYFHKPLYSAKESRAEERRHFVAEWGPTFDEFQIDVVWQGHDHFYHRSLPIRADQIVGTPAEGTIYITTGGAGAPLYSLKANQYTAVTEKIEHYCIATISPTKFELVVKRLDGSILDTLSISK